MNTDFAKSLGILPLSYIEFRSFVKKSILLLGLSLCRSAEACVLP